MRDLRKEMKMDTGKPRDFRLLLPLLPFLPREHTRAERRVIAVTVIGLIALFKYPLIN